MSDEMLIRVLKVMLVGICLIVLGVYLHNSAHMEALGVRGILVSAGCVALGMILSLPTKMYLTFVLMKRESERSSSS